MSHRTLRLSLAGMLWLLSWLTLTAQAALPMPVVRVTPLPASVQLGQAWGMEISVLVPGWFTAPIELPASFELGGTATGTVRLNEGSIANINERIDGQSYAGIRRRYDIVPARAGTLLVPSVAARIKWSDGARTENRVLSTAPLTLAVSVPPGMEGLDYFIATPHFTLTQDVGQSLQGLKIGDAFTRTLTQRATGIPAMQLPALQALPLTGLALYPDEPLLETRHGERGAPDQSLRRQRLTYVLQEAGEYELPGVELRWFDTASARMRVARVPALRFTVTPGSPALSARVAVKPTAHPIAVLPEPTWRERWRIALLVCVGLVSGGIFVRRVWPGWRAQEKARWERFATKERRAFLCALSRLLRASDPAVQLRAIDAWRVAAGRAHAPANFRLERLQAAVYGPAPAKAPIMSRWSAVALLWCLRGLALRPQRCSDSGSHP